ncbi:SDR family oxidoreductase [Aquabacterium sp. CECT 9606]|uniref:SDR family oxidoreductase n=1 Tax=Aquabacterium sp. CECT 9606 TaxID=2845822 RepID=UPI001E6589F5|nr:SDR family oxidoreductase [Aquabacterium sp. CECT 9606]CAH0348190.1 Putative oxidoreductase SadH [Aquabacterium sp. CECT 9606]
MSHTPFENQIVWITGASRGIGAELAKAFAAQGAQLILSAPESERLGLDKTLALCQSRNVNGRYHIETFDLTSSDEVEQAYDRIKSSGWDVDILVHNAGITHRSMALETSIDVDRKIMAVNYFGPLQMTKLVAPDMIRRGRGSIVAVASVLGLIATPHRSAYIAAKHAMHGFFEALRTETMDQGLHVMLAYPGFVNTDISVHALTAQGGTHGKQDPGQSKAMPPQRVAQAIVDGLAQRQPRLLIAGKEGWLVRLQRLAPSLVTRIVRRVATT